MFLEELIKDHEQNFESQNRTQYFFRRTFFTVDTDFYVELVGIMKESVIIKDMELLNDSDIIETNSRELSFSESPHSLNHELLEKGVVKEIFPLSLEQVSRLIKTYKENLFSIDEKVINSLSN